MSLTLYKMKRNFLKTPKQVPSSKSQQHKLIFDIKYLDVSYLHYYFHLENDKNLKRIPCPNPFNATISGLNNLEKQKNIH